MILELIFMFGWRETHEPTVGEVKQGEEEEEKEKVKEVEAMDQEEESEANDLKLVLEETQVRLG
jgi:hypothetical protein